MRRIRLLLTALAVGLLASVVMASPASAAESEEVCLIHAVEEGLAAGEDPESPSAEFETTVSDCFEAPNPLLPEINEVIWGAVGFFTVLGFMMWKGVPAIKATMAARSERIAGDLSAAEAQKAEAAAVLSQYQAQLADSRTESARIIEEARQAADGVKADLVAKANADVADMRAKAAADIEAAKVQAIADLRGEVTALAIGAAEQVVGRNLDQATNAALVEAYIDQVGADR
jgi:F-type H+-transporting ATPase subunit b